jgi:hypothetical protein
MFPLRGELYKWRENGRGRSYDCYVETIHAIAAILNRTANKICPMVCQRSSAMAEGGNDACVVKLWSADKI